MTRAGRADDEALANPELAADTRGGLGRAGQKSLPSRWLYDPLGSALFEAIGHLPEYGLTRADERILQTHAGAIAAAARWPADVVELGSGTGRKTRFLLEALGHHAPVRYAPIDLSASALAHCAVEMGIIPGVTVEPVEADYFDGLDRLAARRGPGALLVLFLGSSIGNFDRAGALEFLGAVRRRLRAGDGLLLGTDLMTDPALLVPAYDDPLGVTAAFDANLLVRLNRELGAGFDLALFRHEARWNAVERRVEMHLVARRSHLVAIPRAGIEVSFHAGESLWTESSHKYLPGEPASLGEAAGFACAAQWVDLEWPFAETLLTAR